MWRVEGILSAGCRWGQDNELTTVTFVTVRRLYGKTEAARCDAVRMFEREPGLFMKSIFDTKKMIRIAVVMLCSAGLAAGVAVAQQDAPPMDGQQQMAPPNGPVKMNPEHRIEMMQRRLNLNDGQTAQIRTIVAEGQTKMETLRANASLAPQDRRAQMEEMRKGMLAKIRGVLTPEQQAKFDDMQAKMRARQSERRAAAQDGSAPPQPPPAPQL